MLRGVVSVSQPAAHVQRSLACRSAASCVAPLPVLVVIFVPPPLGDKMKAMGDTRATQKVCVGIWIVVSCGCGVVSTARSPAFGTQWTIHRELRRRGALALTVAP